MTYVPQPTPDAWTLIEQGATGYPKLFTFSDELKNKSEIATLAKAPRTALISGKSAPACYEESHRVFAGWKAETHRAMSMTAQYRRIRSARDVERVRDWTHDLLAMAFTPASYLREFVKSLERMHEFNAGKLSVAYVLAPTTRESIFAKLSASRAGYGGKSQRRGSGIATKNTLHSYNPSGGIDPGWRSKLEAKGVNTAGFTDADIMTIVEAAKNFKLGAPGFVPKRIKAAALALSEDV